jgi:hypothetical protein
VRARRARSECIDRMYLNVSMPQSQCLDGAVWYLRQVDADEGVLCVGRAQ